jgi:hypothetical protein
MSKPNTSLANLIPARAAPRPVAVAETPAPAAPEPAPTITRRRQPSRAKTVMIAGHFEADVSFAIHELCGKLTRQRGQRVTVQQVLAEALADWFAKHGATPPDGLKA